MAQLLWFVMLGTNRKIEITHVLTSIGTKGKQKEQNLLHACAIGKKNKLFVKICLESGIDEDSITSALNSPNLDGFTPLYMCSVEGAVLQILDTFDGLDLGHITKKGNNILHIYAKRNFVRCIKKIFKSIQHEERIEKMMRHQNVNGNNPLMSCVFKNSGEALNLLLCTLFTMHYEKQDGELLKDIFHQRNTEEKTLLGLILEYQQGMSMHKIVALEMEKLCHEEDEGKTATVTNLTQCLKTHVDASREVMDAIKDVEYSFAKTYFEKLMIWINLFISSFLIPFGVMMSDMSFDIILVVGYVTYLLQTDDKVEPIQLQDVCSDASNLIHQIKLKEELTHFLRLDRDIPNRLTGKPRFFYSSAFIVLPWIFYSIEFCHSRHLRSTSKKVLTCILIK